MAKDDWLRSLGAQLVSLVATWPKQTARLKKVPKTYGNIDVLGRDRHFRVRGVKVGALKYAFLQQILIDDWSRKPFVAP